MRRWMMDSVARSSLATGFALMGLTVAAYWPAMQAGDIWDDNQHVTGNATLRADDALRRIWFELEASPHYYPVLYTTFWIQHRVIGLDPAVSHVVNVVLHALSVVVIWRILRRLAVPGAALCAAVFAVHPVTVESVAWITERKNTLSMVLAALSVLALLRFWDAPRSDGRRWGWYAAAAVAFTLALLTKTVVAATLGGVLVVMWWRRRQIGRADLLLAVALGALSVALVSISAFHEATYSIGPIDPRPEGPASRLAASAWCFWFYLYKALVPIRLAMIHPRWSVDPGVPTAWLPLVSVAALADVAWVHRRAWGRPVLAALLFFGVMLVPTLGFFDIGFFEYSLVADHFAYFALIAPVCLAVATAVRLAGLLRASPATAVLGASAAAAVLAVLVTMTWRQCRVYADETAMWLDTARKNPTTWIAQYNLGCRYQSRELHHEAIERYRRAIALNRDDGAASNNLGTILEQQGRLEEALACYTAATACKRDAGSGHYNLGNAMRRQDRLDEAIDHYRKAVELTTDFAPPHFCLGAVLASRGAFDEAIHHYRQALRIEPELPAVQYNLGVRLQQRGDVDEAIHHYRQAVRFRPDYQEAHFNLGVALQSRGYTYEALRHYRETVRIKPDEARAHFNAGEILRSSGVLDEAAEHFRGAIRAQADHAGANHALALTLLATGRPGDAARAIDVARRAAELTGNGSAVVLEVLADAYAADGRLEEAAETAARAEDRARADGNGELAARIEEKRARYDGGE